MNRLNLRVADRWINVKAHNSDFNKEIDLITDEYYKKKVVEGLIKFRDPDITELTGREERELG